jgi:hypothetical protein
VLEALLGHQSGFTRTPKLGVQGSGEPVARRRYRVAASLQPLLEIGLAAYFTAAVVWVADLGVLYSLPFLMLFQAGFAYVGLASAVEALKDLWGRLAPPEPRTVEE